MQPYPDEVYSKSIHQSDKIQTQNDQHKPKYHFDGHESANQ